MTRSLGPYRLMAILLIRPLINFSSRVGTAPNYEREGISWADRSLVANAASAYFQHNAEFVGNNGIAATRA